MPGINSGLRAGEGEALTLQLMTLFTNCHSCDYSSLPVYCFVGEEKGGLKQGSSGCPQIHYPHYVPLPDLELAVRARTQKETPASASQVLG